MIFTSGYDFVPSGHLAAEAPRIVQREKKKKNEGPVFKNAVT